MTQCIIILTGEYGQLFSELVETHHEVQMGHAYGHDGGLCDADLDTTIVVIGLPTILNDLHATIVHGIWIITGSQLCCPSCSSFWAGWVICTDG